jgi:putative ABC transport system ATP-binding protein
MLIRVKQLERTYLMGDSVVRALAGVDLDISAGEFVSIVGASGSGKSTFMHLLGCLDRPTAGTYELNGKSVPQMVERELARIRNEDIGFVFQTFNLINRTSAIDNVAVPLFYGRQKRVREKAMAALERVGLDNRAKHKPSEMSGGERQRVAIARAIVNNPSVVFADEPTGNLDTRTGEQILEIFHTLHESGTTVILVTHEMSVAAQAQRLIHMTDGLIDADRKVTPELRRELVQSSVLGASRVADESVAEATG